MRVVVLSLMLVLAFIVIDCSPIAEEEKRDGVGDTMVYTVFVETGRTRYAGTNADVFIQLYGSKGSSSEIILDNKRINDFERGKVSKFNIYAEDVGNISKIRIRHNNKGRHSGWFLNKVTIIDRATQRTYEFPCYQWLATDEGDGQISRELSLAQ